MSSKECAVSVQIYQVGPRKGDTSTWKTVTATGFDRTQQHSSRYTFIMTKGGETSVFVFSIGRKRKNRIIVSKYVDTLNDELIKY